RRGRGGFVFFVVGGPPREHLGGGRADRAVGGRGGASLSGGKDPGGAAGRLPTRRRPRASLRGGGSRWRSPPATAAEPLGHSAVLRSLHRQRRTQGRARVGGGRAVADAGRRSDRRAVLTAFQSFARLGCTVTRSERGRSSPLPRVRFRGPSRLRVLSEV